MYKSFCNTNKKEKQKLKKNYFSFADYFIAQKKISMTVKIAFMCPKATLAATPFCSSIKQRGIWIHEKREKIFKMGGMSLCS